MYMFCYINKSRPYWMKQKLDWLLHIFNQHITGVYFLNVVQYVWIKLLIEWFNDSLVSVVSFLNESVCLKESFEWFSESLIIHIYFSPTGLVVKVLLLEKAKRTVKLCTYVRMIYLDLNVKHVLKLCTNVCMSYLDFCPSWLFWETLPTLFISNHIGNWPNKFKIGPPVVLYMYI